jgi:protein CpxP
MRLLQPLLSIGFIAALMSNPVLAQPHMAMHGGCDMTDMSQGHQNLRQQHQEQLKQQLKLQPNQDAAWKAFIASMPAPMVMPAKAPGANSTAIERQAFMLEAMKQRQALMQKHFEATKVFYAQLSATQKQVFDSQVQSHSMMKKGMHMKMGASQ